MSRYTTGELAKLCGVSVRTVQYYDTRGILIHSALSEGGRRLYSQQDLEKLRIICFLRDAGLPINRIGQLFAEEDPGSVISVLLEEQQKDVEREMDECRKKHAMLTGIRRSQRDIENFSVESIGDIAQIMTCKAKLQKIRTILLATAIPFGVMEWTSIFLWIFQGIWWPFAVYTALAVPYTVWLLRFYWRRISYICPQCHQVFKPDKKEFFFARHTLTTRRLTCTCCGHRGFCVETCMEEPAEPEK